MLPKISLFILIGFCLGCSGGHSKQYDAMVERADSITVSWNRFSNKVFLSKEEIEAFKKYATQKDIPQDNQRKFTPGETVELYSQGNRIALFRIASKSVNFDSDSLNFGFDLPYQMGMFIDEIIASRTTGRSPEVRLGNSDYYISLPAKFKLTEARGKEGQLGYGIESGDSSSSMFGFIEMVHGKPVGTSTLYPDSAKPYKTTSLGPINVEWKLFQTETGFFIAFTPEKEELSANVSARQKSGIDSLIGIISTLRKK